jgi:hypothetical protein
MSCLKLKKYLQDISTGISIFYLVQKIFPQFDVKAISL